MNIHIIWGSETGTAEALAELTQKHLTQQGFDITCLDMDAVTVQQLAGMPYLLVITSTWGDGDPPSNAYNLTDVLFTQPDVSLSGVKYSVLALGDTAYPQFCQCGINFDTHLEALGATRMYERVDCDIDYEELYDKWLQGVTTVLQQERLAAV